MTLLLLGFLCWSESETWRAESVLVVARFSSLDLLKSSNTISETAG